MSLDTSIYSFQGRLSESFPSQVMVDITEVCNLGCIHCPHPSFKLSSHYNKKMMNPELNKKMVDEVSKSGRGVTKYLRYTSNGEPLVHPKSYEMIQYAVEKSNTKVTLTTNGTLLNEKKMKKLLETGLHMIDISVDAYSNKTYSKVRVGGNLDITKKNILKLLDLRNQSNKKTKIIVSFVEQKENSSEINDFKAFWTKAGADEVLIRKLHSNSGSTLKIDEVYRNDLNKIDPNENRKPCLYPWERVILNARGMLAFCPTDWYGESEMIDYSETTIKEVWQNKFYKSLRSQHLKLEFKCEFCKKCPDWKNTSWPGEKDKSYADLVENILY
jgi:MoaA/NifB/PqqE/SkfB family radical SAM enzyme